METNEINKNKLLDEYKQIYRNAGGLFDQICALHKENPFTVDDHISQQSQVCFVLSCPGQYELINEKVCWGETGENLNHLLSILNKEKPSVFRLCNRYDYDILNASNVVHFYELDNKTEASKREIEDGIQRIFDYVDANDNLRYIILFGKKAGCIKEKTEEYFRKSSKSIQIISNIPHLGYQALNQINEDVNGNAIDENLYPDAKARTEARLRVVAKNIVEQLN